MDQEGASRNVLVGPIPGGIEEYKVVVLVVHTCGSPRAWSFLRQRREKPTRPRATVGPGA
jgi:hypothetical protein